MKAFISVRSLLILSVLLTVVSAIITYLNVQQKKESISLVIHNYKVIQASTRLLSILKDMELGNRGYLITSDAQFLEPYQEALAGLDNDIDTLTSLVANSPRQLEILQQHILPLVRTKRENLEESISILKSFGRDSASHFAAMRVSKARLDSIRVWTENFTEYEQALLQERTADLEQRYFLNDLIEFSSFVLIGMTSLAALFTIASKEKDNQRLVIELQQLNQQLEAKVRDRTRELEEANKNLLRLNDEKNHFLAITTHDLKSPLAGISGLLELMRLDPGTLSPKYVGYVQLMEETCENMQRLITDLLDLSRIEQGTTHLNIHEVAVSKLMGHLSERFHAWADKKNIKLVFDHSESLTQLVTDQDILIRILDNLVSNAIKFSQPGKTVTISASQDGSAVLISVRDEGPGFHPDELDKLFRKFQKLSARPTEGESSSGLGLSIVKDLVTLLKGTIKVDSSLGQGTSFIIQLPLSWWTETAKG